MADKLTTGIGSRRYNRAMTSPNFNTSPADIDGSKTAAANDFVAKMATTLDQGCAQLGLDLSAEQHRQMIDHLVLLERWNRKLNLTAIVSAQQMVVQHLLDSLAIMPLISGPRILDIGSGGGFPGMPLAVAVPELSVTLLDSRGKRVEFLRHVAAHTKLKGVVTVKSRVEDFRPSEKFDTLVTRAFSSLQDMLQWTAALHSAGSRLVAMKGKAPTDEINQLPEEWRQRLEVVPLSVPFLDAERHAVIVEL